MKRQPQNPYAHRITEDSSVEDDLQTLMEATIGYIYLKAEESDNNKSKVGKSRSVKKGATKKDIVLARTAVEDFCVNSESKPVNNMIMSDVIQRIVNVSLEDLQATAKLVKDKDDWKQSQYIQFLKGIASQEKENFKISQLIGTAENLIVNLAITVSNISTTPSKRKSTEMVKSLKQEMEEKLQATEKSLQEEIDKNAPLQTELEQLNKRLEEAKAEGEVKVKEAEEKAKKAMEQINQQLEAAKKEAEENAKKVSEEQEKLKEQLEKAKQEFEADNKKAKQDVTEAKAEGGLNPFRLYGAMMVGMGMSYLFHYSSRRIMSEGSRRIIWDSPRITWGEVLGDYSPVLSVVGGLSVMVFYTSPEICNPETDLRSMLAGSAIYTLYTLYNSNGDIEATNAIIVGIATIVITAVSAYVRSDSEEINLAK
jgi:hypothetical protein